MKILLSKNATTLLIALFLCTFSTFAEDGYSLWLRYSPIENTKQAAQIRQLLSAIYLPEDNLTSGVIQQELLQATLGMTGTKPGIHDNLTNEPSLIIGTTTKLAYLIESELIKQINPLGNEGYFLGMIEVKNVSYPAIVSKSSTGLLYGTFHLLRLLQMGENLPENPIFEKPAIGHRILNHWDNLDRTVERGYAGFSIWDWHKLPDYIDTRYIDYARANASIGINGTVLTNVNANALVLSSHYLKKVKALADVFRPYGIKVYLTARFSAPIEQGGLETADPLNQNVIDWWQNKVDEIYRIIPDFGGFLVKANSEGQPGPQDYNRTHAEGANMLANAVKPYGGILMWRAFVYSHEEPEDRAKQANMEFEPLDGLFEENVLIQVKNGPIDFQPREPYHPLFGAMKKTNLALELQITQEYLGQGTHLVYLAPMFNELLQTDTYAKGKGSTVARVIEGEVFSQQHTAIAGVSNIGTDRNWTGHHFGQANWYAFGRLAWNPQFSSKKIADEWIKQTFGQNEKVLKSMLSIMLSSHEAVVNYMTPLGLHHIMARHHHYGPGPWVTGGRADWTSVYYHRADSFGIGFDRTVTGSNALAQYPDEIQKKYGNPATCPEKYLLWFHHLPWDYEMKSGKTLWEELCIHYQSGVEQVNEMFEEWAQLKGQIDAGRFSHVQSFLHIQQKEANWWKNACLLYFQTFSGLPFPDEIEKPKGTLEEYMNIEFPYAPGIRPEW